MIDADAVAAARAAHAPAEQPDRPPSRTLPLLAGANFVAASAGMIIAGVLQLIAADLAWTPAQAGHLITVYAGAFALGAPLLGAAFGRRCRKHVVIGGLLLVSIGSVASACAAGSPVLEIARVVVACGAALSIPSVAAIAAFLYPQERPRALAFVLTGMTLAIVAGVPLGTLLGGAYGWRAPLYCAAVLALAGALAIRRFLPGGIIVPPVGLAAWAHLLARRATYGLLAVPLLYVAATFCLYAYIAPFLAAQVGAGAGGLAMLLFVFGLASLATNAALPVAARRVRERVLFDAAFPGLALVLLAMAGTAHRPALIAVLFAAWALCNTLFNTLQQSELIGRAPGVGSALLALNTSASFAGQALGAVVGGLVSATYGLAGLPYAAALLALAAGATHVAGRRIVLD